MSKAEGLTHGEILQIDVRTGLEGAGAVREVKMFGGIGFMLDGNLIAGASGRGLLLRIGKDNHAKALARPGARPLVMRGREMQDYVYVDFPHLGQRAVQALLKLAIPYVQSLPAKKPKPAKAKPRRQRAV